MSAGRAKFAPTQGGSTQHGTDTAARYQDMYIYYIHLIIHDNVDILLNYIIQLNTININERYSKLIKLQRGVVQGSELSLFFKGKRLDI